jgi:hypothetical protein
MAVSVLCGGVGSGEIWWWGLGNQKQNNIPDLKPIIEFPHAAFLRSI